MLEENQVPISARLAEELDVTRPAVTAAIKRMARDGHVKVHAEMLLTEVIGLSWAKAHAEVERMEHAISPEVEALLMKRFAGHKACPHGVPLRGGFAQLRKEGAVLLSELQLHDSAETTLLTLNFRHSCRPSQNQLP